MAAVHLGNIEYVPRPGAIKEILGSGEMLATLTNAAQKVQVKATAMTPQVSEQMENDAYYVQSGIDNKGMAEAAVITGNPISIQDNLKNNTLLKAL